MQSIFSMFHDKTQKCKTIDTILIPVQENMDHKGLRHLDNGLDGMFIRGQGHFDDKHQCLFGFWYYNPEQRVQN